MVTTPGQLAYEAWCSSGGVYPVTMASMNAHEQRRWAAVEQHCREAERSGLLAASHAAERSERAKLLAVIKRRAGATDGQRVSLEWLEAWSPELVSGDFAAIDPSKQGAADE